jgi:Domain of unknown function (DUF4399)
MTLLHVAYGARAFALVLLACLGALGMNAALAADVTHPWLRPPPRLDKESYFGNLKDGASIETPFLVKFGLSGIGLAPVGEAVPKTGHHHLLVNRSMPVDFNQPLPFNDNYIHFGKGQMETVLNFKPGTYNLRLLLADERHIPNFVHSQAITITVTKRNEAVDPNSLVVPAVTLLRPRAGETVKIPFRVVFHVSGFNVSSTALQQKGSGHFRLRVKPDAGREEVIDMTNGYTEAWLAPPVGRYSARVDFIDNAVPDRVLLSSESVAFGTRN